MTYQLYAFDEQHDSIGVKIDSSQNHDEFSPMLRGWAQQRLKEADTRTGIVIEWNPRTQSARSVEIVRV